jgi:hypothetical protein
MNIFIGLTLIEICEEFVIGACKQAKSNVMLYRLYIFLLVPKEPCVDISMNFILGLFRSRKERDFILVIVDRFSKKTHFISCHKIDV